MHCTTYELWASGVVVLLTSSACLNCCNSPELTYPDGEVFTFQHVTGFCMRAQLATEKWYGGAAAVDAVVVSQAIVFIISLMCRCFREIIQLPVWYFFMCLYLQSVVNTSTSSLIPFHLILSSSASNYMPMYLV